MLLVQKMFQHHLASFFCALTSNHISSSAIKSFSENEAKFQTKAALIHSIVPTASSFSALKIDKSLCCFFSNDTGQMGAKAICIILN